MIHMRRSRSGGATTSSRNETTRSSPSHTTNSTTPIPTDRGQLSRVATVYMATATINDAGPSG